MSYIRKAKSEDFSRIAEIEIFNYRLNFYPIFRNDQYYFNELQVSTLTEKYLCNSEMINNTYVYDDGVIKGFISISGREIKKLFVEPVLQGKSIGSALLDYVLNNHKIEFLWALEKNTKAISFYKRHGFHVTNERKFEDETTEYLIKLVKGKIMQIWKAHYRDEFHDTDIEILNDYKELSFILDGVKFIGCTISDFELADNNQFYENKFRLMKYGYNGEYYCTLQRYALDVEIPVQVVRKHDLTEIKAVIYVSFEFVRHDMNKHQGYMCDDVKVYRDDEILKSFSLLVDGKRYSSKRNTLDFENALSDICRKMKQDYYIKSCFTCQYSEYSPYGKDDFGTIMCYRECKEKFLKVKSKADYFKYLGDENFTNRQETFLCSEYDLRNKCDGYRGFVDI